MGCCALGTCVDPACHLCRVTAKLPQPTFEMRRKEAEQGTVKPKAKKERRKTPREA